MSKKLILAIDFNNILFSSYYGEKLINSKGMNINAIKGFFFKIKMLKESLNPDYIVMANDISREKTFRRKLYKQYKANRKTHDPDIINQLKYGMQLASLIGYPFINNEEYEADDILGMLGKYATDNDMDIIIVSSDKDLYQLASDNVFLMSPKNNELIDVNWLYNKYQLTPDQWIELKMIQGDRGDNIPGIYGIGEITAIKLLHQFKNIENIYNHINTFKDTLKEKLIQGKNMLPLTKTLVTILTDYNLINLTEDMLNPTKMYPDEVFQIIDELEIHSLYNVMRYSLLVNNPNII